MNDLTIEDYIYKELSSEEQTGAIEFVRFLKEKHLEFYKDNYGYWSDKIYYWVKSGNECVCFISIKNPEEKNNHWTVWSADMDSDFFDSYCIKKKWKVN